MSSARHPLVQETYVGSWPQLGLQLFLNLARVTFGLINFASANDEGAAIPVPETNVETQSRQHSARKCISSLTFISKVSICAVFHERPHAYPRYGGRFTSSPISKGS